MKFGKIFAIAMTATLMITACKGSDCKNAEQGKKEIGLQLYSVRTLLDSAAAYHNNVPGLLDTLAKMGYTQGEAAYYNSKEGTFYGMAPEELAQTADSLGIKFVSSHAGRALNAEELKSGDLTAFKEYWEKAIKDHKALGVQYLVLPWMSLPETLEDLEKQCQALNEVGAMAAKEGIKFGYHNHSQEFKKVEDTVMYDYMIEHTDPQNVLFEMDVYWAMMGQASPVDYFKKYPGRFKLLHIKDRREIGQSGMVGFDAIFDNADTAGMETYFVELEEATNDIAEGVKESADYLIAAPFVKASYLK